MKYGPPFTLETPLPPSLSFLFNFFYDDGDGNSSFHYVLHNIPYAQQTR